MVMFNPVGLWISGIATAQLMVETHTVVTLRVLGMAGLWPVAPGETQRTWREKPGAFVEAGGSAITALLTGKRPDQVVEAAVRPLRRRTRANSRRLWKRRHG